MLASRDLRRRAARPSGPACRSATRSWRSCSSSARLELLRRRARRRHPGPRRRRAVLRDHPSSRSAGDGGMHVALDRVPLRDSSLAPEEILMSESQERMMAVVEPANVDAFLAICAKWDVERDRRSARSPTPAGCRSTGTARRSSTSRRAPVAHDGPVYDRPLRPARRGRTRCRPTTPRRCRGRPRRRRAARDRAARWSRSPNLCDKSWVTDQYDRYVQRQHRARPARGRRRGPRRRGDRPRRRRRRPTATAGSPSSTRTPARSSRWPRPTATSRRPAPSRSR